MNAHRSFEFMPLELCMHAQSCAKKNGGQIAAVPKIFEEFVILSHARL